jgi:hypothetical protein
MNVTVHDVLAIKKDRRAQRERLAEILVDDISKRMKYRRDSPMEPNYLLYTVPPYKLGFSNYDQAKMYRSILDRLRKKYSNSKVTITGCPQFKIKIDWPKKRVKDKVTPYILERLDHIVVERMKRGYEMCTYTVPISVGGTNVNDIKRVVKKVVLAARKNGFNAGTDGNQIILRWDNMEPGESVPSINPAEAVSKLDPTKDIKVLYTKNPGSVNLNNYAPFVPLNTRIDKNADVKRLYDERMKMYKPSNGSKYFSGKTTGQDYTDLNRQLMEMNSLINNPNF